MTSVSVLRRTSHSCDRQIQTANSPFSPWERLHVIGHIPGPMRILTGVEPTEAPRVRVA